MRQGGARTLVLELCLAEGGDLSPPECMGVHKGA